jgi:hypothetical protein
MCASYDEDIAFQKLNIHQVPFGLGKITSNASTFMNLGILKIVIQPNLLLNCVKVWVLIAV